MGLVKVYKALIRLMGGACSVSILMSMTEAFLSFFTVIKLLPHESPEWSSLVPDSKAKSSSEIVNPTLLTVSYQDSLGIPSLSARSPGWQAWHGAQNNSGKISLVVLFSSLWIAPLVVYCDCAPSTTSLRLLLCLWLWDIFFWWAPACSCWWLFNRYLQFWCSCRRGWVHVLLLCHLEPICLLCLLLI